MNTKPTKSCGPKTKPSHKPYKVDLEVKGQCYIRIMSVYDTSSHGDRPGMPMSKQTEVMSQTRQKPIKLIFRSKVNV